MSRLLYNQPPSPSASPCLQRSSLPHGDKKDAHHLERPKDASEEREKTPARLTPFFHMAAENSQEEGVSALGRGLSGPTHTPALHGTRREQAGGVGGEGVCAHSCTHSPVS